MERTSSRRARAQIAEVQSRKPILSLPPVKIPSFYRRPSASPVRRLVTDSEGALNLLRILQPSPGKEARLTCFLRDYGNGALFVSSVRTNS